MFTNILHKLASLILVPAIALLHFGGYTNIQKIPVRDYSLDIAHLQQTVKTLQSNTSRKLGASDSIPQSVALFQTTLQSGITSSATSMLLVSASYNNGVATLASSTYGFILDEGTVSQELILADCTGITCTNMTRGIDWTTGTTSVTSLKFSHRRGASVKITDAPVLLTINNIFLGKMGATHIIKYDSSISTSSIAANRSNLVDWGLVQDTSFNGAGAIKATTAAAGYVQLATQLQQASSTGTSGGNPLVLQSANSTSTYNSATAALNVVVTQNNGKIDSNFLDSSTLGNSISGMSSQYATSSAPVGWLIEDGSAVSRTLYASLFNVIGTTYGAGDGATTFTLPASIPTASAQLKSIKLTASQYAQNTSTSNLTSSSGDGSVALWFNLASSSGSMNEKFVFNNRAANILVGVGPGFVSTYINGGSQKQIPINTAFASSTWYHLALSYNSTTGVATAYVNGSSTGSISTGGSALQNTASTIYVGANQGTGDFFPGNIADVKFYNRQLSPQDVIGSMGLSTTTGVTGFWPLNGTSADYSGNGNNLTLVNSPSYATTTMPDISKSRIIKQ